MRYAIVFESAAGNYSAYVPDLPGCIATGSTIAEVEREIREAIVFHLEGMREAGLDAPVPAIVVEYVEVAACSIDAGRRRALSAAATVGHQQHRA